MEYMRIEGFLGKAFSKLINKAVENKVGFKPEIDLSNMSLRTTDAEKVELNVTVSITKEAFEKLIEEATK
jgi:hypothetical protein